MAHPHRERSIVDEDAGSGSSGFTQFNRIIQTGGYNSLVEKMRSKQTQFTEEDARKTGVK
jgi:hypothetical protein